MISFIYRSTNKLGYYLYLAQRDDFSPLPLEIKSLLGKLELAMILDLKQKPLAHADNHKVIHALLDQGFYLQIPPPCKPLSPTDAQ